MTTGADIIAKRLYKAGCRHAFGIPGGEVLTLIDALARAGVRFSLCKHENSGGFMAEGTWHATGAPGVLVATVGPGVANLVNVVANALQDRVPMIVLTGCVDAREAATYTHQVFDHRAILAPVTKASFTLADGAVDVLIDKALAIAMDGQPGPVHLDLPIQVAGAVQDGDGLLLRAAIAASAPAQTPDLAAARSALAAAQRPLVIAGVDALNDNAGNQIADFIEAFQVPLITTYKAKGIVPEGHPLVLGGAGLSPKADEILMPLVARADVVILAGYDPIEMRVGWQNPWADDATVIEFSAVPNTHYMHQASFSFICHTAEGLTALREGVSAGETWPENEPSTTRQLLDDAFPTDEAWSPAAVVDTVRKAVPDNTVVTADTGAHRILLSQMWQCPAPRSLLQSSGLCTMGCALPLAIGHRLADDTRPVVAFTGDAGLEMVLGELATLRDLHLPVIVIVFVDRSLALIEMKQRNSGFDNLAVDFGGTDFAGVADAMGGVGITAEDRGALTTAVRDALARETYTVIACPIEMRAYDGRI